MTMPGGFSSSHQQRLDWFADRAGQITCYPAPLEDGSYVVTRPKGIYKPADLEYALSVRINLASPYADGKVKSRPDGSWFFDYHQENADPELRDREYTNVGLLACVRDGVPVGVLQEREVAKNARSQYSVLGLAVPVGWRDGYFFFESVAGPSGSRGDTAAEILISTAEHALEKDPAGPPSDDYDARRRVYRQIVARRGQRGFRRVLLAAYESTCAVTRSSAEVVLEAAHLRPYRGPESNVAGNGLLLRTDIHTLLDLQLLAINPQTREVLVSKILEKTDYAGLAGTRLREPTHVKDRPTEEVLITVLNAFLAAEAMR